MIEYVIIKEGKGKRNSSGGNLSLVNEMVCGNIVLILQINTILEELFVETTTRVSKHYFYYMKQNGVFDKIKGIWLGNYDGAVSIEKILLDTLDGEYNLPIIKSNNFGHIDKENCYTNWNNGKN